MSALPKPEKFPVRLIAVDNIKVDQAIQSRVRTSPDYMREFSEAMLRGDVFPPVVVFSDGRKNWLADGFHRHGAAKRANAKDIRAEVRPGTRRDALVYSAGANKAFSIPRTADDIRKSVRMLLDDPEWFERSFSDIGVHVGCAPKTAKNIYVEYCAERNIPPRDTKKAPQERPTVTKYDNRGVDAFVANVGGKTRYLGSNRVAAERKLTSILVEHKAGEQDRIANRVAMSGPAANGNLVAWLVTRRIAAKVAGNTPRCGLGQAALAGDSVIVCADSIDDRNLREIVGSLFLNRAAHGARRMIAVANSRGSCGGREVAEILGVEFLTPDELAESLKGGEA